MAAQTPYAPLDQFVLFGDSITELANDQTHGFSYASALQHDYMLKLDVINRGFSGYNTTDAVNILPSILPTPAQAKIRFLVLFFGANDSSLGPLRPSSQHVPLDLFAENLKTIISHPLVAAHSPRPYIILVTPPPIEETFIAQEDVKNGYTEIVRLNAHTTLYAEAVRDVGRETGTVVVDLWSKFMEMAGWKAGDEAIMPGTRVTGLSEVLDSLLIDGLHLTPAGYKVLYEEVTKAIAENWPEEAPGKLKSLHELRTWAGW